MFLTKLGLKISISEYSIDDQEDVTFRDRKWVPNYGTIYTKLIQDTYNIVTGRHPGREETYSAIARKYFWPGMSQQVRQFTGNCDSYRSNKA